MNKKAMYSLSYGLFVLTARVGGKDNGCIINTAGQVTSEPNRISIAVNKSNLTHDMVKESGKFNISILSEKASFDIFKHLIKTNQVNEAMLFLDRNLNKMDKTEMKDINKLNFYQNNKCIIELNTPIEYIFSFPSGQIAMYKGKVNVIEIYHLTNSSLSLDFTISIKESYTRPCAISNDRIATYSSSEIYIYSCFGSGVETISIP